jgi:hypothetical protein
VRMNEILQGPAFERTIRANYDPIQSLYVGPDANTLPPAMPSPCHHLFLFSSHDAICKTADTRAYSEAVRSAVKSSDGGSCTTVQVGGTHCDGLWLDGKNYTQAVRAFMDLMEK